MGTSRVNRWARARLMILATCIAAAAAQYPGQEPRIPLIPPPAPQGLIEAFKTWYRAALTVGDKITKWATKDTGSEPAGSIWDALPDGTRDKIGEEYGGDRWYDCKRGAQYVITSQDDLNRLRGELACIYSVGEVPIAPPMGPWYGHVHEVVNSDFVDQLSETFWAGKFAFESQCRHGDTKFHMLQNIIFNGLAAPALMYIGDLTDPVSKYEPNDDRPHLFVDYTVNFADVCPVDAKFQRNINLGVINNPWPVRFVVDLVRKVGEQPDGGHVMLGKTLYRDGQSFPQKGDMNVGYWSVVSYDNTAFQSHEEPFKLPPIRESFTYKQLGLLRTMTYLLSIDNLMADPKKTLANLNFIWGRAPLGLAALSPHQVALAEKYPTAGTELGSHKVPLSKGAQEQSEQHWYNFFSGRVERKKHTGL